MRYRFTGARMLLRYLEVAMFCKDVPLQNAIRSEVSVFQFALMQVCITYSYMVLGLLDFKFKLADAMYLSLVWATNAHWYSTGGHAGTYPIRFACSFQLCVCEEFG